MPLPVLLGIAIVPLEASDPREEVVERSHALVYDNHIQNASPQAEGWRCV
jgi:hypothetical protein